METVASSADLATATVLAMRGDHEQVRPLLASAAGSCQVIVFASGRPSVADLERVSPPSARSRYQLELVEPEHVGSLRHERRDQAFARQAVRAMISAL